MNSPLIAVVIALCLGTAAFALWHSWRGYRFSNPLFYAVIAVELAVIAVGVVAGFAAAGGGGEGDPVLFWSYFATTLIIAPIAVIWAVGDKTRWGTGVLAIAMVTIAILVVRCQQIWNGHG